jgi:hypothetical protein
MTVGMSLWGVLETRKECRTVIWVSFWTWLKLCLCGTNMEEESVLIDGTEWWFLSFTQREKRRVGSDALKGRRQSTRSRVLEEYSVFSVEMQQFRLRPQFLARNWNRYKLTESRIGNNGNWLGNLVTLSEDRFTKKFWRKLAEVLIVWSAM